MHGLDPIYRQLAFTLGGNPMEDTADGAFLSALVTSILAGVRLALVSSGSLFFQRKCWAFPPGWV